VRLLKILWALPNTLLGLCLLPLILLSGGRVRLFLGCVEMVANGWIRRLFHRNEILAVTLGHVIIGKSGPCLFSCRSHEHVHVRQCERWGPLFLPAYFYFALLMRVIGKDPYWDNPFELDAFENAGHDVAHPDDFAEHQCK